MNDSNTLYTVETIANGILKLSNILEFLNGNRLDALSSGMTFKFRNNQIYVEGIRNEMCDWSLRVHDTLSNIKLSIECHDDGDRNIKTCRECTIFVDPNVTSKALMEVNGSIGIIVPQAEFSTGFLYSRLLSGNSFWKYMAKKLECLDSGETILNVTFDDPIDQKLLTLNSNFLPFS